jgi:hypothetical protein
MPNGNGTISITLINEDGRETVKSISDGTKVSQVVGKDKIALLNGLEQKAGRDRELRPNDRVQVLRRSYKNGC